MTTGARARSPRYLLAAAVAAAIATPASAVRLDPDGLGQALIFPYYTAREANGRTFNTLISIVNHTIDAKALRVNVREARGGRIVLAMNLYLSAVDVWTAAIIPWTEGGETRAAFTTNDMSCTAPPVTPAAFLPFEPRPALLQFTSAGYSGSNSDGLGEGPERTREGYIEVIEMAQLTGTSAAIVTHGSQGKPANCALIVDATVPVTMAAPSGGVSGSLTLINVNEGFDFTLNAEALADLSTTPYHRRASDPYPGFDAAEINPVSVVNVGDKVYRATWSNGAQAVWAALSRREGMGEFILDAATLSRTDMVVTFPMQPYGVSANPVVFTLDYRNREGRGHSAIPCEGPFAPTCSAQWDRVANGATFDGGLPHTLDEVGILASTTGALITTSGGGFNQPPITTRTTRIRLGDDPVSNGSFSWRIGQGWNTLVSAATSQVIDTATGQVTTGSQTYVGLPTVGFTLRTFRNGTVPCGSATCQGNYGGAFPLKFRRDIAQ